MSTYWRMECLDHTPPLRSLDEFTQHTEDRHYHRAIELIGQRPVERDDSYWTLDRRIPTPTDEQRSDAYFEMNARAFLSEHPTCRIGMVSEYGERRSADGAERPRRVQLSRRKGWRMPENTVSVARPTKWGNPYVVGKTLVLFTGNSEENFIGSFDRIQRIESMTAETAVALYRLLWLTNWNIGDADIPRPTPGDLEQLRGKNLACWCPLPSPGEPDICHAAVLLELANPYRGALGLRHLDDDTTALILAQIGVTE